MDQLNNNLELYLVKKAPGLSPNAKEAIVKFGPWIALILMILAAPPLLFLLGLGALISPFAYMGGVSAGTGFTVGLIVTAIAIILEIIALPGLFKRTKQGWTFMYYSTLVSFVGSLLSFNVLSGIIGALISLYILFQIRSYYK